MRIKRTLLSLVLIAFTSGCYPGITGTVIDAETGKPIEGAVVLVEWTKTKGLPGMPYTESYKVVESATNREGKFKISGVFTPFVNKPDLTIYKKGYVAWNNEFIFPDYKKREDFRWDQNYVFRMNHFRPGYSFDEHTSFISDAIHSWSASEKKALFKEAYKWEEDMAFKERQSKAKIK